MDDSFVTYRTTKKPHVGCIQHGESNTGIYLIEEEKFMSEIKSDNCSGL